mgnify:CR=1 FL=1
MKTVHQVIEACAKVCDEISLSKAANVQNKGAAIACASMIRALKSTMPDSPILQPGMVAVELDRKRIELRLHGGGVTKQKTQQTGTAVTK